MFDGLKARAHWIVPVLDVTSVAKRTVSAIKADEEEVYMPAIAYWIAIIMLVLRAISERGRIILVQWLMGDGMSNRKQK